MNMKIISIVDRITIFVDKFNVNFKPPSMTSNCIHLICVITLQFLEIQK